MIRLVCLLLAVVCVGCEQSETPAPSVTHAESAAAEATTPPTESGHEALPRAVAGVALGMSAAEVEQQLGALTCHDNPGGFRVCTGSKPLSGDATNVQAYLDQDRVISISYDSAPLSNVWDFLDRLTERYGRPSLSGVRERDKAGRLHETYGWKDADSLYSVRLIWRETEAGARDLAGATIALWDRQGYQRWEAESAPRPQATAGSEAPREET